ncbi:GntR family transcriptional regulator [Faecalicatena contorta]|uniref:GntR family transcriptional regulator n=1 Tax=Faecalicatena contorta TaxID=39482 RepID=UPI00189C1635
MNYEKWAFHDITPISRQLIQKLIYAILSNELSSGDSIPSVREMAEILHIKPQAVRSSLDISSTMLYLHQAIWSVIMPHMKQASSLAIAIFATLLRFPFPSTIL